MMQIFKKKTLKHIVTNLVFSVNIAIWRGSINSKTSYLVEPKPARIRNDIRYKPRLSLICYSALSKNKKEVINLVILSERQHHGQSPK